VALEPTDAQDAPKATATDELPGGVPMRAIALEFVRSRGAGGQPKFQREQKNAEGRARAGAVLSRNCDRAPASNLKPLEGWLGHL